MKYKRIVLVNLLTLCLVSVSVRARAQSSLESQRVEIEAQKRKERKERDALAYREWMERIVEQTVYAAWTGVSTAEILVSQVPIPIPKMGSMMNVPFMMMFGAIAVGVNMIVGPETIEWKEYVGIIIAGVVSGRLAVCDTLSGKKCLQILFISGGIGIVAGMASMMLLRELVERYERLNE